MAAALLAAALVLTGRWLDGPPAAGPRPAPPRAGTATERTQAPYRVGTGVTCPSLWPVLAMADHRSYPLGHPARLPTATAVACYQTTDQAAGAGYPPAPLPAGALEIGGVYLAPTSRALRASCHRAADRVGFPVPCPGLLPTAPAGSPPPRLCDEPATCRRGQVLWFTQGAFVVPPGYVGAPGGYSALAIVAAPTRAARGGLALRCRDERRLATPRVHRAGGVLALCADDPHRSAFGGSVLLRWSERGTVVVVSVLDRGDAARWSAVNQRLAVALADHLHLVLPDGPGRG